MSKSERGKTPKKWTNIYLITALSRAEVVDSIKICGAVNRIKFEGFILR